MLVHFDGLWILIKLVNGMTMKGKKQKVDSKIYLPTVALHFNLYIYCMCLVKLLDERIFFFL